MSSEIVVPETPNWLQELEDKREKRLKAKLGHETGAGAPCLKCGDKCPGLDLHFWRKCCKICRCSKEEHEVQDDDIYGWAQFQLLGNKPSKIKRKIVLPGKKDELELDWVPKGHNDVVDKYLKTLPPEKLPVKGSQAAQDRKQQLQKQIPVHDIDPMLCHELTDDELNKMNEYIAHVKNNSVGVGQIVNLSNIIKGNLHMLNPSDAALIASRYPKGIPLSEIVKLHSMSKVDPLKHHYLSQDMRNITINDRSITNLSPNNLISREETMSPISINKMHDINYTGYTSDVNKLPRHPQYSSNLNKGKNSMNTPISNKSSLDSEPEEIKGEMGSRILNNQYLQNPSGFSAKCISTGTSGNNDNINIDANFNERFMPNTNFNPKNLPSQFINQHIPQRQNIPGTDVPYPENSKIHVNSGSAFVPYSKSNSDLNIGTNFSTDKSKMNPNILTNMNPIGKTMTYHDPCTGNVKDEWEETNQLRKDQRVIPNYIPGKYNQTTDLQAPMHIPRNIHDLAFSTYDSNNLSDTQDIEHYDDKIKNVIKDETKFYPNSNKQEKCDQKNWTSVPKLPESYVPSGLANFSAPTSTVSKQIEQGSQGKKILSHVQPGNISVPEDFLEPSQIYIGAIKDIDYPEIKAAIQGTNDFYEDYSPDSIKEILNNVKLPDCHYCKKPFEEKEFAVTIERANVLFHADCFKCAGCNQHLADNFYFYNKENNNIYCGRDYAKIRGIPRCKACDELIFTKEYCLAEDNTFHLKHFCCTECDTPLAGQDYILDDGDGMPYCLPCFERSKADSCNSCDRVIKPDEMGCNLNGVHFHADDQCFACKICHKPLIGKKLLLRNKKLYCSHECYGADQ